MVGATQHQLGVAFGRVPGTLDSLKQIFFRLWSIDLEESKHVFK